MIKKLFQAFKTDTGTKSPVAQDVVRMLSGMPDNSPRGRAVRRTQAVMDLAMVVVGNHLLNETEATKEASIHFMIGTALGYCRKFDVNDQDGIREVVRRSLRSWMKNPAGPDHFADHLAMYLEDDEFAGVIMDSAANAVCSPSSGAEEVALELARVLRTWRTFDMDAFYARLRANEDKADGVANQNRSVHSPPIGQDES